MTDERTHRYAGLMPVDRLAATSAAIVGVGAVGYSLARTLAAMGIGRLILYDPDTIEDINLGPQGWSIHAVGQSKAATAKEELRKLNEECRLEAYEQEGDIRPLDTDIVFACVDSMTARRRLHQRLGAAELFIDCRVGGRVAQIIGLSRSSFYKYPALWQSDDDSRQDPCTERMTPYMAQIASAFATNFLVEWLNDGELDTEVIISPWMLERSEQVSRLALTDEGESAIAEQEEIDQDRFDFERRAA